MANLTAVPERWLRALYARSPRLRVVWRRLRRRAPAVPYAPVDPSVQLLAALPLAHDGDRFSLSLWVNHSFKWPTGRLAFASVFSGSNDRGHVRRTDVIERDLAAVARRHPTTLLTVVGGMYFLDLVARVEFDRVVLFDENVAELGKAVAVLDALDRTDGAADAARGVEEELRRDPGALLPRLGGAGFSLDLGPDATWELFGRTAPAVPILPSDVFPEFAWAAGPDERRLVVERLRRSLVRRAFHELPHLDADGHLVVVFASNISAESVRGGNPAFFTDATIAGCITNAAGVLIVRSFDENDALLDPHPYWEAVARSLLRGRSHQVWGPEDRSAPGTRFDRTTPTSSLLDEADPERTAAAVPVGTETLLLHVLIGKAEQPATRRREAVARLLRAVPDGVRRVVVAEFNPGAPSAPPPHFADLDALADFTAAALAPAGFVLTERAFAPGAGDAERNVFLVHDR